MIMGLLIKIVYLIYTKILQRDCFTCDYVFEWMEDAPCNHCVKSLTQIHWTKRNNWTSYDIADSVCESLYDGNRTLRSCRLRSVVIDDSLFSTDYHRPFSTGYHPKRTGRCEYITSDGKRSGEIK